MSSLPIGAAFPACAYVDGGVVVSDVCPSPGLCGGTLLGPNSPVSYCTLACKTTADCPSGTACETKLVNSHCLKKCTADADCSGGFVCRSDVGSGLCWSPFMGADLVFEGGSSSSGSSSGGSSSGGAEAGVEASAEASAEASIEASAEASIEAGSDAAGD